MAASKHVLSVSEVIDEVCLDVEGIEDGNDTIPELSDAIKSSVHQFYALRRSLDSYTQFKSDASECIERVYRMHESGTSQMDKVILSFLSVRPLLSSEVITWINRIYRRMSANPKARNPWTIEVKRDVPEEVFNRFRDTVRGAISSFGVLVEESLVKYINKNRLVRDFSKFCGRTQSEIKENLKKAFGGNRKGFKGEVLVSDDKPFSVCYDRKRMQVKLSCHYGCWNEFGYGFHE